MKTDGRALAMGFAAVVCWAVSPVAVRFFSGSFTILVQAFWRYLLSLALLWALSLVSLGPGRFGRSVRSLAAHWPKVLVVATANYGFQVLFNLSLYRLHAGMAALLNQSTVLFGALFAAVFFPDERAVLGRPAFAGGLLLALAGVTLTIIGQKGLSASDLGFGVAAMLGAALCWGLMGALIRLWLAEVPSTLAVSAVFTLVTPAFLVTALLVEAGPLVPAAGTRLWLLLAASSIVGLGFAYPLYYSSLPRLGLALASGLGLLIPLLVAVFSALVLGERLGWLQLAGAFFLLPGCWLIIRARFRAPVRASPASGA
jgi:drug/metabolite transporter (DMT)-like permease